MIRILLIVDMPNASDERMMTFFLGPFDGLVLRLERLKDVVTSAYLCKANLRAADFSGGGPARSEFGSHRSNRHSSHRLP
jgi:hypothetical protein